MKVLFHPDFPRDLRKFRAEYAQVSDGLAARFENEIDAAIEAIKNSPASSGHFLNLNSTVVPELRRRNLKSFPFFILYGLSGDRLIFGSVIPSRSDPLKWLTRFRLQKS